MIGNSACSTELNLFVSKADLAVQNRRLLLDTNGVNAMTGFVGKRSGFQIDRAPPP